MARFQQTLASQASFEKHGRKSKRELFLDQMNRVVPWSGLLALVEPHYPSRQRPATGWAVDHAADLLSATVVRLV